MKMLGRQMRCTFLKWNKETERGIYSYSTDIRSGGYATFYLWLHSIDVFFSNLTINLGRKKIVRKPFISHILLIYA